MITPTRALLEAALEGFEIQRKAIEAKQQEIREALKSPVEVMAAQVNAITGPKGQTAGLWRKKLVTGINADGTDEVVDVTSFQTWPKPKRQMTAAGRAAISRATKARWKKYRKEHGK